MPEHTEAKSCVQCILYSTFLLGAHGYCMAALHSMFARAALFYDHLPGRTGADRRKQIRGFNPKLKGTIVRIRFFCYDCSPRFDADAAGSDAEDFETLKKTYCREVITLDSPLHSPSASSVETGLL